MQMHAKDKDRQLKDFMYDKYMEDITQRRAKKEENKKAIQEAENRRIAVEERKFVKTDWASRLKKAKFVNDLNDATEYAGYLKQAEKEKEKDDHEGYLRHCQEMDSRK